jgi:hypothetical protein
MTNLWSYFKKIVGLDSENVNRKRSSPGIILDSEKKAASFRDAAQENSQV